MNFVYVQEYEQFSSKFHSNFPDILKIFSHFTTFSNIWNFYLTIETKKHIFHFPIRTQRIQLNQTCYIQKGTKNNYIFPSIALHMQMCINKNFRFYVVFYIFFVVFFWLDIFTISISTSSLGFFAMKNAFCDTHKTGVRVQF